MTRTYLAVIIGIFSLLAFACDSGTPSGVLAGNGLDNNLKLDGDLPPSDKLDGDTAENSDEETATEEDKEATETEETAEIELDDAKNKEDGDEPEKDTNIPDGDETTPPIDGDTTEPDGDDEIIEQEPDIADTTIPVQCDEESDPIEMWTDGIEAEFKRTPWVYEGDITSKCKTDAFFIAGAKGMEVKVTVSPYTTKKQLNARMMLADVNSISKRNPGKTYSEVEMPEWPKEISTTLTLPYNGEYLVIVSGKDYLYRGKYQLTATCTANCDKNFNRFPVALLHGMGGFDEMLGVLNYFNGVYDDLTGRGYEVYVTDVAMFDSSQSRARQLEPQLLEIIKKTGARKLNLVAHSQGGLDSRHFISVLGHGDMISVLAMVATPNHGVILGDMILGTVKGFGRDLLAGFIDFFADLLDDVQASDIEEALTQISVQKMRDEFNPAHPDDPRVRYWSWAGVTCQTINSSCYSKYNVDVNEYVGFPLNITYPLIMDAPASIGSGVSDGMVPLSSAKYGEFMGQVSADHADEIGQLKSGNFDHKGLYRTILKKLYTEGF